MNLFGATNNLELGNIQLVDYMAVMPILSKDNLTDNIALPFEVKFVGNNNYGNMTFENSSDKLGIVPENMMAISKYSAQDHCMSKTGIIMPKMQQTYSDCCCVQSSQCGYMHKDMKDIETDILPLMLRKRLTNLSKRHQVNFRKLWDDISTWLEMIPGIRKGSHLEYFFEPYRKELDNFCSEFEPVNNQVGAFIFFGDYLVGIEITPTFEHWTSLWRNIIRGTYASEITRLIKGGVAINVMAMPNINSTYQLEDNIKLFLQEVDEQFKNIAYKSLIDNKFNVYNGIDDNDGYLGDINKSIIKSSNNGGGTIIKENNELIYTSLVL